MPEGVGYGPNIVAGAGLELNVVGDFAYAYNQVGSDELQSITNTLDFTTGKYIFVGEWTVCGAIRQDEDSPTGGVDQFYLKLNGIVVQSLRTEGNEEDMPTTFTVPIIIPPLTHVEISCISATNNALWQSSNTLTGAIYK